MGVPVERLVQADPQVPVERLLQEVPPVQEEAPQPEDPQQLVVQHLLGDLQQQVDLPLPLLVVLRLLVAQPLLVVPHLLVDLPQQEPLQLPLQLEQPPPISREEDKQWNESSL